MPSSPISRRTFLKNQTLAVAAWSMLPGIEPFSPVLEENTPTIMKQTPNLIGSYGEWAASLHADKMPKLSFRNEKYTDIESWRPQAKAKVLEAMAVPDLGPMPSVQVHDTWIYESLQIEELSWQLPHGHPTRATLLKPVDAPAKLPGILAFHDHSGDKFFGRRKIIRTGREQHPHMQALQDLSYEGKAWANEIAKRGYVVLVPDAFTFGSRRVMLADVSEEIKRGVIDPVNEDSDQIKAYNSWASNHEHILAKSLFCAGTTWPGVFFSEDRVALDILCAREDVDEDRIGCGGLSGGGLRTDVMGGLDERIKCAVSVGFMSTWRDFLLNKTYTHTWMTYMPGLPPYLDFPEVLGLRCPLPTMVLFDEDDFLYTLPEMKGADKILQDIFEKAGAKSQYKGSFYPGGHKFDQAMQKEAFEWFDRYLK